MIKTSGPLGLSFTALTYVFAIAFVARRHEDFWTAYFDYFFLFLGLIIGAVIAAYSTHSQSTRLVVTLTIVSISSFLISGTIAGWTPFALRAFCFTLPLLFFTIHLLVKQKGTRNQSL